MSDTITFSAPNSDLQSKLDIDTAHILTLRLSVVVSVEKSQF